LPELEVAGASEHFYLFFPVGSVLLGTLK